MLMENRFKCEIHGENLKLVVSDDNFLNYICEKCEKEKHTAGGF
jgi:hypothetical protein